MYEQPWKDGSPPLNVELIYAPLLRHNLIGASFFSEIDLSENKTIVLGDRFILTLDTNDVLLGHELLHAEGAADEAEGVASPYRGYTVALGVTKLPGGFETAYETHLRSEEAMAYHRDLQTLVDTRLEHFYRGQTPSQETVDQTEGTLRLGRDVSLRSVAVHQGVKASGLSAATYEKGEASMKALTAVKAGDSYFSYSTPIVAHNRSDNPPYAELFEAQTAWALAVAETHLTLSRVAGEVFHRLDALPKGPVAERGVMLEALERLLAAPDLEGAAVDPTFKSVQNQDAVERYNTHLTRAFGEVRKRRATQGLLRRTTTP